MIIKIIKTLLIFSFLYILWYESRPVKNFDKIKYDKYKSIVPKSKIPKEVLIYFRVTKEKQKVFEQGYKNLKLNDGEKKIIAKYKSWLEFENLKISKNKK